MSDRRVHPRGRKGKSLARAIACEELEGRVLLSGVGWTGAGDGFSWTDARNWSSNPALPGPQDDVTVALPTGTIHLGSGDQSVHSLISSMGISLDGGSLSVAAVATETARVTLNGGELKGGTWTLAGTGTMLATVADSTLDGVTVNGTLNLSTQDGSQVTVLDGLTVNGSVLIGNSGGTNFGRLQFGTESSAAGALTGHATVVFGRSVNNAIVNQSNRSGDAGTLTLGGDTIHGTTGTISATFPNGSLLNRGGIEADNGGTINVNAGSLVNDGTLGAGGGTLKVSGLTGNAGHVQLLLSAATIDTNLTLDGHYVLDQPLTVSAQATVNLNGNWSGSSTITVSGGRLNLGGVFSVHPGEIVQSPIGNSPHFGGVSISGTLLGDVTLDTSTGSWGLGGTIIGGTITETQGAQLTAGNGTLNGVTVNGPLEVGSLTVLNGLVLNGNMQVGRVNSGGSYYGYLTFGGPDSPAGSLTGTGTIVLGGRQVASVTVAATLPGSGLTIGPNITIRGAGHISSGAGITNNSTVVADTADILSISGPVTNNGTLGASNNGELELNGAVTDNGTMSFQSHGILGGVAALTINSGGRVVFAPNSSQVSATLSSLTINGSGVMDLGNTILQINYPDAVHRPDVQLRSYLRSGYDSGRWDGPGIVSSLADATHGLALADSLDGVVSSLPPMQASIQLARVGDLNLDGRVDFADLLIMAQHWGQAGANWDQGDLNYDGSVGFSDLLLLGQNFGTGPTATNDAVSNGVTDLLTRRRLVRRP